MKILSVKPGHDGAIALIDAEASKLVWSFEAEKDSYPRYSSTYPGQLLEALERFDQVPDVIAMSGWSKGTASRNGKIGAGYTGFSQSDVKLKPITMMGKKTLFFSSSHIRSHIMSGIALSPFAGDASCYVLVWEGAAGDFYLVDEKQSIFHLGSVMSAPGRKFAFIYALADPSFSLPAGSFRLGDAGKLMALAAYGEPGPMTPQEKEISNFLLHRPGILNDLAKNEMCWSPYFNIGLNSPEFRNLARRYSDEIFRTFADFAQQHLTQNYPLVVTGGCGLNCDWNTAWRRLGLFKDVFVPPCANDSGSAIGTAADAMRELTGKIKLEWCVYSGQDFEVDLEEIPDDVLCTPLNLTKVADFLAAGGVLAWARGACEIGPRSLGNRSLFAAPFKSEMRQKLNRIKQREDFRPIAPICLLEDVELHFEWSGPSDHMLYFQKLKGDHLGAVTHVDGTARVQTVDSSQNPDVYALLLEFRRITGHGVLCNTSLNFNGAGFINRLSDLYQYCKATDVGAFVYKDKFCTFKDIGS